MKEWLNFLVLLFESSLLMSTNCDNVVFKAALSFLMFWHMDDFVKSPSRAIRRCFADRGTMKANRQNPRADFQDLFRFLTRPRFLILHSGITITAFSNESRESPFRKRLWNNRYCAPILDGSCCPQLKAFWESEEFIMWVWSCRRGVILEKGEKASQGWQNNIRFRA